MSQEVTFPTSAVALQGLEKVDLVGSRPSESWSRTPSSIGVPVEFRKIQALSLPGNFLSLQILKPRSVLVWKSHRPVVP